MDLTTARDLLSACFAALSITSILYTWSTARSRASAVEIAKLREILDQWQAKVSARIEAVEVRVTKLESEFHHMPDGATVHTMQLSMTQLNGEIAVLTERLKPIGAIADRLQEFLLDQANKR